MPSLLQRSKSDSDIYQKRKISKLSTRIMTQAHHPEGFKTLHHPKSFKNISDWIKYWPEYHEKILYWKKLFDQVDYTLQHYQKIHHKWTLLSNRHKQTVIELEDTRKKLDILHQSDRIDFFENEKLENRILVLEKKEREDFFTPEIKQQIGQNVQRFIDWKNQDSVINISRVYQEWLEWETEWRKSFNRLLYNLHHTHKDYYNYYSGLSQNIFEKLEFIVSREWYLHPDPEDYIISDITLEVENVNKPKDTTKNTDIKSGRTSNNDSDHDSDCDTDSEDDLDKVKFNYRKNRIAKEVPIFKKRLGLISEVEKNFNEYQTTVSKLKFQSICGTNLIVLTIIYLRQIILSSLGQFIQNYFSSCINFVVVIFLVIQYCISFFPKYCGFITHQTAEKCYNMYEEIYYKYPKIFHLGQYWISSNRETYYKWKNDTFIGYGVYRNRIIELSYLFILFQLFYLSNIFSLYTLVLLYWNWWYSQSYQWIIFKPYQVWMAKIKFQSLKEE